MSAAAATRSAFSLILLIIGFLFIVFAAIDFLIGFGIVYSLLLIVLGIIFIAIARWV
jgi:hypothetical protein